jgi:hypothetical protein
MAAVPVALRCLHNSYSFLHRLAVADGPCQRRRPELFAARLHKHRFIHRMFYVVLVVLQHQASYYSYCSCVSQSCEPELVKLPLHGWGFMAGFAFSSPASD